MRRYNVYKAGKRIASDVTLKDAIRLEVDTRQQCGLFYVIATTLDNS